MKIIDSHVHVWAEERSNWGFDQERTNLLAVKGSAQYLQKLMSENQVAGALIVQPICYRFDHRYLNFVLQKYPKIFKGMCLVDLSDSKSPEMLRNLARQGYRGVRINPSLTRNNLLNNEIVRNVLEVCIEFDIAAGFLISPDYFKEIEILLSDFPKAKFIIDHFGRCTATQSLDIPNENFDRLIRLSTFSNLYIKISGWPVASQEEWPYSDVGRWIKPLIQNFGVENLMWGTDFPFIVQQCGYQQGLKLLTEHVSDINEKEIEWLLGKTSEKVFGIWK